MTRKSLIVYILLSVLILTHLLIINKTFSYDRSGNIHSTLHGYGDIPLHMTQVSKFAFTPFDLHDPIFVGENLHYPFIINYISGMLLKFSGSWKFSMLFPIMFLAISNILLCFYIFNKFIKNQVFAFLAVLLFFFGGGFGTDISFGAPIDLVFMHQRPFFLGFFVFLLLIICLIKIIDGKNGYKYGLLGGLLLGSLPLIHTHTFVAAGVLTCVSFLYYLINKDKEKAYKTFGVLVLALLISLPQIYFLLHTKSLFSAGQSFTAFRLGWMMWELGKSQSFLYFIKFLWINFGIILPTFIIVSFFYFKKIGIKNSFFWISNVSAIILFLLVEAFRFQPWDWDDNKIMVYFQFFAVPIIIYSLFKFYERNKATGTIAAILIVSLSTFSGFKTVIAQARIPTDSLPIIFTPDDLSLADFIKLNIKSDEILLTSDTHLNPVSSLAGRQVLVGYSGWLWTRGINYQDRDNQIKDFLNNPNKNSPILKDFNISKILIDKTDPSEKVGDLKDSGIIFQNEKYSLYEI